MKRFNLKFALSLVIICATVFTGQVTSKSSFLETLSRVYDRIPFMQWHVVGKTKHKFIKVPCFEFCVYSPKKNCNWYEGKKIDDCKSCRSKRKCEVPYTYMYNQ